MRLASLALGSLQALSAMCPPFGPSLCDYARGEAVFLGRAVEAYPRSRQHVSSIRRPRLTRTDRPAYGHDTFNASQITRFEVLEGYRGVQDQYVVLQTKIETDSGYLFEQGATYLVFARRDKTSGLLTTSGCSYTQRITGDNPDLSTIRQLFAETKRGRFYGYATTERAQFLFERTNKPAPSVTVTLTSPALTLKRTTAPDGTYDFSFIPAGRYTLTAHLSGQAISLPHQPTIEPQSCSLLAIPVTLPSSQ